MWRTLKGDGIPLNRIAHLLGKYFQDVSSKKRRGSNVPLWKAVMEEELHELESHRIF